MATPTREAPERLDRDVTMRRRWLRPAFAFGVAMTLIVGALGVGLWVFGGGDETQSAGLPEPSPGPATITPEATASITVAPGVAASPVPKIGTAWTLVSVPAEIFGDGFVTNVATVSGEFIAVGATGIDCAIDASQCRGAVWRSPDGAQWERLFVADALPDGLGTWLWDVVRSDVGYLAMGDYVGDDVFTTEPVMFASTDGTTWQTVDPVGIVLDTGRPRSLLARDGAYLLAGQSCEELCTAAIWRSGDGTKWAKVLDYPIENSSITAMEFVGDRYMAAGGAGIGGGLEVAKIWSSHDGIEWLEVSTDMAVFGGTQSGPGHREYARAVAAGGPGYVVVGSELGIGGMVWLSEDGATWVRVPDRTVFAGAALLGVVEVGGELIAVGAAGGGDEPRLAVAWRSVDGFAWERMNVDPELIGSDSAFWQLAADDGLAVAGLDVDGLAAIWAIRPGG